MWRTYGIHPTTKDRGLSPVFLVNEVVRNVVARNCAAEGIMLDTNKNSQVIDCQAYGCRVGLFLNGNDDWKDRGSDNVTLRSGRKPRTLVLGGMPYINLI